MDKKDEQIIRVLERNAKLSSRALAENVNLPISTAYRRIKKLEEEGVIAGYRAMINYEKTKKPIGAYIFINLSEVIPGKGHIPKEHIVDKFKKFDEIREISDVQAADFDLILKTRLTSLKELSTFIEKLRGIDGVEEVSSAIVTDEIVPL